MFEVIKVLRTVKNGNRNAILTISIKLLLLSKKKLPTLRTCGTDKSSSGALRNENTGLKLDEKQKSQQVKRVQFVVRSSFLPTCGVLLPRKFKYETGLRTCDVGNSANIAEVKIEITKLGMVNMEFD